MHRLLVETDLLEETSPVLPADAARHLKVLRPKDGEEIELFDGRGKWRVYRFCASLTSGKDSPRIAPASQLASLGGYASPLEMDREKILEAIRGDKKRSGDTITLVVPRKVGECELVETPMSELGGWLA